MNDLDNIFEASFMDELEKIAKMMECPATGKMVPEKHPTKRKGRRLGRGQGKGPMGKLEKKASKEEKEDSRAKSALRGAGYGAAGGAAAVGLPAAAVGALLGGMKEGFGGGKGRLTAEHKKRIAKANRPHVRILKAGKLGALFGIPAAVAGAAPGALIGGLAGAALHRKKKDKSEK